MAEQPLSCAVRAGSPGVVDVTVRVLRERGLVVDDAAELVVLLDMPRGFALATLEGSPPPRRYLVVTDSPCAEYWEDLWELQPAGLLACAHLRLIDALHEVARGEGPRITPGPPTTLTPGQRRIFRLLARGYANREIAGQLIMQPQTVKNTVAAIYDQLGLANRNQAMLHYWGIDRLFAAPDSHADYAE
jgi:DNA-binding NarL/FixJ family response regulator